MVKRAALIAVAVAAGLVLGVSAQLSDAQILQGRIDAQGAGIVDLGPVDLLLDRTVTIPSGIQLRGAGAATHLRVAPGVRGLALVGSHASVRNLLIDGLGPQPAEAGISFRDADWNDHVSDIVFGHYLGVGVDVAPGQDGRGIFTLRNLRWNGVLGSGTAVRIGDGLHHISDILVDNMSGTADSAGDMAVWVDVLPDTDTVDLHRLTLIRGGSGVRVGYGGAPASVTGFSLTDSPAIESMSDYGVALFSAQNARLHNVSVAQSLGGLAVYGGVRGLEAGRLTLHYNQRDGATIFSGAQHVTIAHSMIADNNISNGPFGFGISLGAGLSYFTLDTNIIGNGILWGSGSVRYCIFLPAGPSNNYRMVNNSCRAPVTGKISDGGTGTPKFVSGNF